MIKSICVYLGAKEGNNNACTDAAIHLGEEMARRGLTLVYGGSSLGLMGRLGTSLKNAGGRVIGIMPKMMIDTEIPLNNLDELLLVDTLLERKLLMAEKSDAFIVMPGGLGTLDELFETWSALRLGLLGNKPLGFLNVEGYYDQLFGFMNSCEASGFVTPADNHIPTVHSTAADLLADLCSLSA